MDANRNQINSHPPGSSEEILDTLENLGLGVVVGYDSDEMEFKCLSRLSPASRYLGGPDWSKNGPHPDD